MLLGKLPVLGRPTYLDYSRASAYCACSGCGWGLFEHFVSLFFLPLSPVGGAKVLGKLPVPGRPTFWITVGQGPTALAAGAGGGCLDIFTLSIPSFLFLPVFGRRPDID